MIYIFLLSRYPLNVFRIRHREHTSNEVFLCSESDSAGLPWMSAGSQIDRELQRLGEAPLLCADETHIRQLRHCHVVSGYVRKLF